MSACRMRTASRSEALSSAPWSSLTFGSRASEVLRDEPLFFLPFLFAGFFTLISVDVDAFCFLASDLVSFGSFNFFLTGAYDLVARAPGLLFLVLVSLEPALGSSPVTG